MSLPPTTNNQGGGKRSTDDRTAELEASLRAMREENKRLQRENSTQKSQNKRLQRENSTLLSQRSTLQSENKQLKETEKCMLSVSLFAVVSGSNEIPIPNLQNKGTSYSHNNPRHAIATATKKLLPVHEVSKISPDEWENIAQWMKTKPSLMISKFVYLQGQAHSFEAEADVQYLIHLALDDAVNICQKMILMQAEKSGGSIDKIPRLVTRKERSIFANRVDHMVVFDCRSHLPVFSVESKKFFDGPIRDGIPNKVYGQSYDQLRAIKAKGHKTPFAAISSFQETFITWLDSQEYNDVLDSHTSNSPDRLNRIMQRLPIVTSAQHLTQSPPKATPVNVTPPESPKETSSFQPDNNRQICRSEQCFESNSLVRLFLNVTFCALDAVFSPRSYLEFENGKYIKVDAIRMDNESYVWGTLKTTMKGALHTSTEEDRQQELFLVDSLGSGSTSVVYRALTKNGYDCVVKIFVAGRVDEVETNEYKVKGESNAAFQQRSKEKVDLEVRNYQKIYGTELDGYVWTQTLNNLECVILPFFRPIQPEERYNVLPAVQERLQQFQKAKMVFTECDQLWRHVGLFRGKIFLFDLGDLEKIDNEDLVKQKIASHYNLLKRKAGADSKDFAKTPARDKGT